MSEQSRIMFLLIFWIWQLLTGGAADIGNQTSAESNTASTVALADYSYTPQEGSKTSSQEFYYITAEQTATHQPLTSPQPCQCTTEQTTTRQPPTCPPPIQCPDDPFQWVKATDGEIPPDAIVGGWDQNNEATYIARVNHEGSLLPGKLVPSHKVAYVSYYGLEIKKSFYEVLCRKPFRWVDYFEWRKKSGAVPARPNYASQKLYICKFLYKGALVTGKRRLLSFQVQDYERSDCSIPFNGSEVMQPVYQVLFQP